MKLLANYPSALSHNISARALNLISELRLSAEVNDSPNPPFNSKLT